MIPPRRRSTRWRVDSCSNEKFESSALNRTTSTDTTKHHLGRVWQCLNPRARVSDHKTTHICNRPIPYAHSSGRSIPTQTQRDANGSFPYLLDVVVGESAAIFKLLSGKDQTLLVGRNTLLVLDLGLDIVDGVARLDVEGNGLTRQGLDEAVEQKKKPSR